MDKSQAVRVLVELANRMIRERGDQRGARRKVAQLLDMDPSDMSKLLSGAKDSVGWGTIEKAAKALPEYARLAGPYITQEPRLQREESDDAPGADSMALEAVYRVSMHFARASKPLAPGELEDARAMADTLARKSGLDDVVDRLIRWVLFNRSQPNAPERLSNNGVHADARARDAEHSKQDGADGIAAFVPAKPAGAKEEPSDARPKTPSLSHRGKRSKGDT